MSRSSCLKQKVEKVVQHLHRYKKFTMSWNNVHVSSGAWYVSSGAWYVSSGAWYVSCFHWGETGHLSCKTAPKLLVV